MGVVGTRPILDQRMRWSLTAKCPRQAVLGGLGVEPAEPGERLQRLWQRGRLFGWYVGEQFKTRHGDPSAVVLEHEVPWAGGVAHADVLVRPERLIVEVKSTTSPASLIDDAFFQVAGLVHFSPDADHGAVLLLDPVDLDEVVYPVIVTDEWAERIEDRVSEVLRGLATKGDDMPPCVCDTPGACKAKGCLFTEAAWEGWTPPPPEKVAAAAEPIALELYQLQRQKKEATAVVEALDKDCKDARARLLEAGVEPGVEYQTAALSFKASAISDTERLSLSAVKKAGMWTPELEQQLRPFVNASGAHVRFTFRRLTDEPLHMQPDFGDEAPF